AFQSSPLRERVEYPANVLVGLFRDHRREPGAARCRSAQAEPYRVDGLVLSNEARKAGRIEAQSEVAFLDLVPAQLHGISRSSVRARLHDRVEKMLLEVVVRSKAVRSEIENADVVGNAVVHPIDREIHAPGAVARGDRGGLRGESVGEQERVILLEREGARARDVEQEGARFRQLRLDRRDVQRLMEQRLVDLVHPRQVVTRPMRIDVGEQPVRRVVEWIVYGGAPTAHGREVLEPQGRVQTADAGAARPQILVEGEARAVDALAAVVPVRAPEVEEGLRETILVLLSERVVVPAGRVVLVEQLRELEQRGAEGGSILVVVDPADVAAQRCARGIERQRDLRFGASGLSFALAVESEREPEAGRPARRLELDRFTKALLRCCAPALDEIDEADHR